MAQRIRHSRSLNGNVSSILTLGCSNPSFSRQLEPITTRYSMLYRHILLSQQLRGPTKGMCGRLHADLGFMTDAFLSLLLRDNSRWPDGFTYQLFASRSALGPEPDEGARCWGSPLGVRICTAVLHISRIKGQCRRGITRRERDTGKAARGYGTNIPDGPELFTWPPEELTGQPV